MHLRPRDIAVSERWFNQLVIGAVALGFLALAVAGFAAAHAVRQGERYSFWVGHTYQVERAIYEFRALEERIETTRRGYVLQDNPAFLKRFRESSAQLLPTLAVLVDLTRDNPRQQVTIDRIRGLALRHRAILEQSVALAARDRPAAIASFSEDRSLPLIRAVRRDLKAMTADEDRLLAIRLADQAASVRHFNLILTASGILVLLVGTASMWIILRYTRDLTTSRAALRGLNENLEGAVRERTTELQRANEEIQRFAYIVSHDLRSPLVNVMGFTSELETATRAMTALVDRAEAEAPAVVTQEARLAAREDLPEAIGFIRSSTQKMDRLINAILRLSREGRRPITPERIDMPALAQGVADSFRHRAGELGAAITIAPHLPGLVSDRLAVEQILSNIVENALKYLKADRPGSIAIDGRIERGRALYTVADNGRGIDPRDHDRIFDLFRRSGAQDQPGEGIGLAHTRALAYRLGGTITVESSLGEGATFRINLPLIFGGEQGPAT